jgi:hypothetical protein
MIVYWTNFKGNWYWWLLVVVLILAVAFGICCYIRSLHISEAAERRDLLESVAGDINRRYLKGVGSKITVGDEGAWLGVEMDPRRTNVVGEVELDEGEMSKADIRRPGE